LSVIFVLCFGGLRRLSGITRPAGGLPAEARARLRASFAAVNRLRGLLMKMRLSPQTKISTLAFKDNPRDIYRPTLHRVFGKAARDPRLIGRLLSNSIPRLIKYLQPNRAGANRTRMSRALLVALLAATFAAAVSAQIPSPDTPSIMLSAHDSTACSTFVPCLQSGPPNSAANPQSGGTPPASPSAQTPDGNAPQAQQTRRILQIIPNFHAVSAQTQLPPLSVKSKFVLATKDSFDYSSFFFAGILAAGSQMQNSYPEFHQGAAGFGRYYWHTFTDQAVGNYFTEAIFASATHEDPRYYTLGTGGVFRRTVYAAGRLFITRTDSNEETFNLSEIMGNGAAAGMADLYYPRQQRGWTKTGQRWVLQLGFDGVFNVFEEFWPDIRRDLFRQGRT